MNNRLKRLIRAKVWKAYSSLDNAIHAVRLNMISRFTTHVHATQRDARVKLFTVPDYL